MSLVSGEKSNFQYILRLLNTNVEGKQKVITASSILYIEFSTYLSKGHVRPHQDKGCGTSVLQLGLQEGRCRSQQAVWMAPKIVKKGND